MILNVFYKGKGAAFEYANQDGMLNYRPDDEYIDNSITYTVHIDQGFIAWTHGKFGTGGNSINPTGKLGQNLIKLAKEWINNPETIWKKEDYWNAWLYTSKHPPFKL